MKEGADFQPTPPNNPHDPLLAALRERLGENFGQEPPAALWAGIRQQLPGAPRPWWRGRRLLVLLLGFVVLGGFWLQQGAWRGGHFTTRTVAIGPTGPTGGASTSPDGPAAYRPTTARPSGKLPTATSAAASTRHSRAVVRRASLGPQAAATAALPVHAAANQPTAPGSSTTATTELATAGITRTVVSHSQAAARTAESRFSAVVTSASAHSAQHRAKRRLSSASSSSGALAALAQRSLAIGEQHQRVAVALAPSTRRRVLGASAGAAGRLARRRWPLRSAFPQPTYANALKETTGPGEIQATRPIIARSAVVSGHPSKPDALAFALQVAAGATMAAGAWPAALDSLASRQTAPLLAAHSLPAMLTASADSDTQWLPSVRRWEVLVLAGPSISYRTSGLQLPANQQYATSPTIPASPSSPISSFTSSATLFEQERPAAGWGLQVQVRRVLTGRWKLAVGAGYQEYATWLTSQIKLVRTTYNNTLPDTAFAINHRDTYRFLTVPVQFSYALCPPHGRLSLGALGGVEPSWYQGGSATLLSSPTARSLSFSSATGSPYSYFNLALSLGLDAHYRLGGPASRWQWVVQPTARYLVTPFVRGGSSQSYASRQPYSLGLLTGFAWQLR